MKKYLLRLLLFMIILFILLLILSWIVVPKINSEEAGMNNIRAMKILGEKENTVDVIIYGDSESFASIIPIRFWENYGFTAFICGTSGQTLPDTCRIAYDTLKKQSPKIIILEADNIFIPTEITVPLARVLYEILPITEYHNRWKSLDKNDFFGKISYTQRDVHKGYHLLTAVNPADNSNYMTYTEEKEGIPTINKIYVKLLKKYFEFKGSEFAIVSVPSTSNWNYKKHNGLKEFAEKEGIEFLDLNIEEDLKIDWQTETADAGDHVNKKGAEKVTEYLGKWLKEKKILKNHKDDEDYNKIWNNDLDTTKIFY